jgi:hypothetical protein
MLADVYRVVKAADPLPVKLFDYKPNPLLTLNMLCTTQNTKCQVSHSATALKSTIHCTDALRKDRN